MSALSKLMQARINLQACSLTKSGHNKFAGYKYFELGDFLPTIQKLFHELKLAGVVSFAPDIATLTITDLEDGTTVLITSPMSSAALKGCHEVQNLGAVQTYIRRYLWVNALEIVEHDALDATTGKETKASNKSVPQDVWESLDQDTQEWMLNEAMAVTVMLNDGDTKGAVEYIESLGMNTDHKVAFWSRLDSKQRSAITAYTKAYKGDK